MQRVMRIRDLNEQIAVLVKERERLKNLLDEDKSKDWLRENNVRREHVQMSSGDGIPYHGVVNQMLKWMKENNISKPYFEWNGRIYNTNKVSRRGGFTRDGSDGIALARHLS